MRGLKEYLAGAVIPFDNVDLLRSRLKRGEEVRTLAEAVRTALAGAPQANGPEAAALIKTWLVQQLKGKTVSETVLRAVWSAAVSAVRRPTGPRLLEVKPGKELDALWADADAAAEEKKQRLRDGRKAKREG